MALLRFRRSVHRATLAAGAALVILGASGCTAVGSVETNPARAESARVTETPAPAPKSPESTAAADEITCATYADVATILHNAQTAYFEDRMTQQELDGWFAVASRVLGSIPSAGNGTVSEALAALQQAVPAVPDLRKTNFAFPDVGVAGVALNEACGEAGFEIAINAFTGG